MGSDRARRTYDESRQYRRVVPQQGRVVVEADANESQEILTEETRKEALDVVGPCGTPDDGYRISTVPGSYSFNIGKGTMYVGGMRVSLPEDTTYVAQPDWLHVPALSPEPLGFEFVYLRLREQEVGAVEDAALREVALGGPDTAQRTRLVQRVHRRSVSSDNCPGALAELESFWEDVEGLDFDPKTMRLLSKTTLKARFEEPPDPPDPCAPQAQTGYLGAENQLLRVQVASHPTGGSPDKLLWAFDNASALYRIVSVETEDAGAGIVALNLASSPPDAHRAPRENQVAEILGSAVSLGEDGAIAEPNGKQQHRLSAAYDPINRRILVHVPGDLADFYGALPGGPQYVRIWEDQVALTHDTWTALGSTGVEVNLQKPAGKPFAAGDYWLIGVRPRTPQVVYPRRLLDAFQPPDGPREWVCPLALLRWFPGTVMHDCRQHFDNLVELSKHKPGCCTVSVTPEDLTGGVTLQAIVDSYTSLMSVGVRVAVCLRPGTYVLDEPLRITNAHVLLTIDGCHQGATLSFASGSQNNFLHGMIILTNASNVTLRGLRLNLPQVPFDGAGGTLGGHTTDTLYTAAGDYIDLRHAQVSVGIRLLAGVNVQIHDCTIESNLRAASTEPIFGALVFAQGGWTGLDVRRCTFRNIFAGFEPQKQIFGFLHVPSVTFNLDGNEVDGGKVGNAILDSSALCDNVFEQLTTAVFIAGQMGALRFEGNRVRTCAAGFWYLSLHALSKSNTLNAFKTYLANYTSTPSMEDYLVSIRVTPIVKKGSAFGRAYPLPDDDDLYREEVTGAPVLSSLHDVLAKLEEDFMNTHAPPTPLVLSATSNDIDLATGVSETAATAAAALSVWETQAWASSSEERKSELIVGNNRMRGRCPFALAMSILVNRCTVTGNLILNEAESGDPPPYSVVVICRQTEDPPPPPYSRAAVTGNVFLRQVDLPVRNPTTLPPWADLNHVEV